MMVSSGTMENGPNGIVVYDDMVKSFSGNWRM